MVGPILELTAVLMDVAQTGLLAFGTWYGYKNFLATPNQEPQVTEVADAAESISTGEPAHQETIVFKTNKQETKLRATARGLECELRDERPGKISGTQWVLSRDKLRQIQDGKDFRVVPGLRLKSGVFSVGPRHNWLYSKELFPDPIALEKRLGELIENAINE